METTIVGFRVQGSILGYIGNIELYWGYIGIMDKTMEPTIMGELYTCAELPSRSKAH